MEHYVIVPIIAFVGGWLGSFLGAYLKKKGENLATREDIDGLVEQVRAVTRATKEIEAKISDEVWGRQRVWEMKRDAFFALIKAESTAFDAILILESAYATAKNFPPESTASRDGKMKALQTWQIALTSFETARVQALLVCEPDVEKRLDSMDLLMKNTVNGIAKGEAEFSEYSLKLMQERKALRTAVRAELTSGQPPSSPSS